MSKLHPDFIGFPPPLLGEEPHRLPVYGVHEGLLAMEKPPGVVPDAHPWYPQAPSLAAGINAQAKTGKPELEPLGLEQVFAVHPLDAEISGITLLALSKEAAAHWREVIGSRKLMFHFSLAVQPGQTKASGPGAVDLPLVSQGEQCCQRVSHRKGRKCLTEFRPRHILKPLPLWEAKTDFLRWHQVRLHAFEFGLGVSGESFYARVPPLRRVDLKTNLQGAWARRPLYPGLAMRLHKIEGPGFCFQAPPDRSWRALEQQLEKALSS